MRGAEVEFYDDSRRFVGVPVELGPHPDGNTVP
jgi:hypothetical protein